MSCDTEKMISCSEEEFDRALQEINMKELVLIISKLQAAMIAEQQHFSTIHNQIEKLPNKSGAEHAALSEQLVKSQEKIGQLMQRNMKCFNAKTATEKASKSVMDKSAIHSKVPESGPAKPPVMIASAKMEDPHPKKQGPQPKVNATQVPVTVVPNDTRNGSKTPRSILKKSSPSTVDASSSSNSMSTDKMSVVQTLKGSPPSSHEIKATPPVISFPPNATKSSNMKSPTLKKNANVSFENDALDFVNGKPAPPLTTPSNKPNVPIIGVSDARISPTIPFTNIDDFDISDDDEVAPVLPASPPPVTRSSAATVVRAPSAPPQPKSELSPSHAASVKPQPNSKSTTGSESQLPGRNSDSSPAGIAVASQNLSKTIGPTVGNSADRDMELVSCPVSNVAGKSSKMVSVVPRKKSTNGTTTETSKSLPAVASVVLQQTIDPITGQPITLQDDSPDDSVEPVQRRRVMFETHSVSASSCLPDRKTVTVRPNSLPPPPNSSEPAKGKLGTVGAASSPSQNGSSSSVMQGKMVSVIPRKKNEVKKTLSAPIASGASVVLQNGASLTHGHSEKTLSKTNQGGRIVTVGRVSGHYAVDVSAEDMMRDEREMDYAIGSVTVKAKFQTGKMASFKKDKSDNNNLKGSIDIPDDNGVTEAVSMAEYQGQDAKDVDEELVKERTTLLHWDPVKLLDDLYEIKQAEDHADDLSSSFIQMAGYMEKLPMNKKKATMLKTWKRRYFKAKDGNLFYYDGNHSDKPTGFIQLLGGSVEDAENRMIGIDDGRGHYCLLRCPTDREHQDWIVALNSQVSASPMALYVKPSINPKPHFRKKVVIIDIGGASVRGGVIGMEPSLPQVFFPCVVAINKTTGEKVFGFDAFKPEIRSQSNLIFPLRKSAHVDKVNLDKDILPGLLKKVFNELKRHPTMYHLILSTPHTLSAKTLSNLMDSMLEEFQVKALSMVYQPIMALYSYSATSGVVVDIGERCDVVPVIDGFLMTAGISRQPYGAVAITELLNQNLAEHKFRFHTDVEKLFTRLVLERACYVSQNFNEDNEKCIRDREPFTHHIDVGKYNLPEDTFTELTCDSGRFRAAEGLFDTELYGQDTPFLHKAIHKAIQDCPMDSRREMCRSIYLSGGTTMLPGFAERLKTLMETLVPKSCVVEVHASPHRYHAAYIGACIQAGLDGFEQSCITLKEWKNNPQDCLRRLQSF
ncbi:uncharacterized protein LOC135491742 isoform X2 [Lineus longissimus]|uniref:uncharacterized protein LOC135491742 isoform X2 n=1 Tax=Lineus longissimus TaxID=88925 RepID=UPI002B4F612C